MREKRDTPNPSSRAITKPASSAPRAAPAPDSASTPAPPSPGRLHRLLAAPLVYWFCAGLLIAYAAFFVRPVFFNAKHTMFIHPKYVPYDGDIGSDLMTTLRCSRSFFVETDLQKVLPLNYPPLCRLLMAPLLLFEFHTAYVLVTVATIAALVGLCAVMPAVLFGGRAHLPLTGVFLVTALFSYPFHFELERGQFNLISICLCFAGVYLFHYHYRWRYAAYALFIAAVHLKVTPVLFAPMFVRDWRDWKGEMKRFAGLGAANVALLFVLGPGMFAQFVKTLAGQASEPYVWQGNHSVHAWALIGPYLMKAPGLQTMTPSFSTVLYGAVLLCVFLTLANAFWRNRRGPDPFLWLGCSMGWFVLPAASMDYKLAALAPPVLFALIAAGRTGANDGGGKAGASAGDGQEAGGHDAPGAGAVRAGTRVALTVAIGAAYGSTLFSYEYKVGTLFWANFPALMVILAAGVGLMILTDWTTPPRADNPR